jgi:small subunit ribosomal protein S1
LDKGIILELEHEIEGLIPFGRKNKNIRSKIMEKYKRGDELTAVVMEVKPNDKKIILILDELNDAPDEKMDDIKEYMETQKECEVCRNCVYVGLFVLLCSLFRTAETFVVI